MSVLLVASSTQSQETTQPGGPDEAEGITLTTPVTPGRQDVPDDVVVRHGPTGLPFPTSLEGMDRISIAAYDRAATDMSAGYHHDELPLTVTVYLYPQPEMARDDGGEITPVDAIEALLDHEAEQIMAFEPAFKPGLGGRVENLEDPIVISGWRSFATDAPTDRHPVPVQGMLALAMLKPELSDRPYLAKVRATYPLEHAEQARTAMLVAMTDLLSRLSPDEDEPSTRPTTDSDGSEQ